jgi:hypothetical protein
MRAAERPKKEVKTKCHRVAVKREGRLLEGESLTCGP